MAIQQIEKSIQAVKSKKWWHSRIIILALFMFFFAVVDFLGGINPMISKIVGLAQAAGALLLIYLRTITNTAIK